MPTTHSTISARALALLPILRAGERVAVLLFFYPSALSWVRDSGLIPRLPLPAVGLSMWGLSAVRWTNSGTLLSVIRGWLSLGPILPGYWSADSFAAPPMAAWQAVWLGWDRIILDDWGLRATVECAGFLFPSVLESARTAPPLFYFVAMGLSTAFGIHRALRSRPAILGAAFRHYGVGGRASVGVVAPVCTIAGRRGKPVA